MRRDVEWAIQGLRLLRRDVAQVLTIKDTPSSQVSFLERTRKRLLALSLEQNELFEQACDCAKVGAYRAAHVMSWAAFIDFLERKLGSDGLAKVKALRPAWSKYRSLEELREEVTEHALIEVAREAGLISKAEMKSLHGLLAKRNECAHPSGYKPGASEAVGYIAELLNRIESLQHRTL